MQTQIITTVLGEISVSIDLQGEGHTLVFMHGIFLDKTLWFDCAKALTGHRHIYLDMPAHGQSSDVGHSWSLEDCGIMLLQILDTLGIDTCIAIGHSWGGMTALRTAAQYPERFQALGLFNVPTTPTTGLDRVGFHGQKLLTRFQRFYAQQVARSMYSQACLKSRPELLQQMQKRLAARSSQEIIQVINAVILDSKNSAYIIRDLQIPVLFVAGELDFVEIPPGETLTVPGKHISPHEAPVEVNWAIQQLINRVEN